MSLPNDGEVTCKACGRGLNRTDLNCFACGSTKLDRSRIVAVVGVDLASDLDRAVVRPQRADPVHAIQAWQDYARRWETMRQEEMTRSEKFTKWLLEYDQSRTIVVVRSTS